MFWLSQMNGRAYSRVFCVGSELLMYCSYRVRGCLVVCMYTGARLQRVQLQRAPGYSEQIFTGRNEVVAKVMFLQVCVCPQGGEGVCLSACWDAIPPRMENPPGWRTPPGKQTPAYGLRAAGTHPTGMHSCSA